MTGHTPTPWSYKRAKFAVDGEFDCGISAVIDGHAYCIAEAVGKCAKDIKLPAEANAAYIVQCVNGYAELVEVLEFIRDGYDNHDVNHVDYRVKVYQVALEALTRAKAIA